MEKPIARLDREHDILSIFIGHQGPCRFEEELPGLVCRYDWSTGELIGVTIVDFERYWRTRLRGLAKRIARHLGISHAEALALLKSAE